jgi:hypothetical protein
MIGSPIYMWDNPARRGLILPVLIVLAQDLGGYVILVRLADISPRNWTIED